MIAFPKDDEYSPFYAGYVKRVPESGDIFEILAGQPSALGSMLKSVADEQANVHPAVGEWSIKEVLGHVCDTERIFAYRALRIARGDTTALAGFEQNVYVNGTDFNKCSLPDLIDEFSAQRQANVLCFKPLTEAEIARVGTASEAAVSVRALLFILAGHVMHHIESLKMDYNVGA